MSSHDFDVLFRALKKGAVDPVYYLHGDEDLLKDEAVRDLVEAGVDAATRDFNLDRRRAPELAVEDFHALVQTPPMMAARRGVIISEVEYLLQKKPKAQALRAAVIAYAARPSPETMLVLVQSAGEKALDTALVKTARTLAMEPLAPDRLVGWIRREAEKQGVSLDDAGLTHLQATVGTDLPVLASELAKLGAAVGTRTATASDVADLVGVRHGETVYDFVDAVTGRREVEAAGMVQRLLEAPGTSAVRLVAALSTALVGTALARALLDEGQPAGAVESRVFRVLQENRLWGLRTWQHEAAQWTRDAERWAGVELDAALEELLRADRRLKHTTVAGGAEILQEALLAMAGEAAGAS